MDDSLPFRHFVVVVSINGPLCVLKANVVKARKRCSIDVSDFMVWDQKQFLHVATHHLVIFF